MTVSLACVVGARPNFMKMAPLLRAFDASDRLDATLIHTGQHYDPALSDVFFEQLEMRRPDRSLAVGSGSQAVQTARILEKMEETLLEGDRNGNPFQGLVVVGDVNSTLAAAIAAAKLGIKVAHVEAGLRSFDRSMPEEINRLATDAISDLLLPSEPTGQDNLLREGHSPERVHLVGNVMIDTLLQQLAHARLLDIQRDLEVDRGNYAVVTLHRPSNVDDEDVLRGLVKVLQAVSVQLPVVFPIHPRTQQRLEGFGLLDDLRGTAGIRLAGPMGYLEFLSLTSYARVIVTDSGGLQEESTALGIPCLTMRSNTERPITVEQGTSTLIGNSPERLAQNLDDVLSNRYKQGSCPQLWDGKAAGRIARVLESSWS
jgi:UDP-N-acetylglucosamine 2-epimerase (non-hydrolysing)